MIQIRDGLRDSWRKVGVVDACRAACLFGDRSEHRFTVSGLRMRVERVDCDAIAVGCVDDGAGLRGPETFADEDERLAPMLLAQALRERLQCRRYDLRARRLGRFRVAAHEVALELGARCVVAGMSFERRDQLADEGVILREGDRMQWVERLHQRDHVAVAKETVDQMGQRGSGADCRVACTYVELVEKNPDDASAALLQLHGLDHARFPGIDQLEISGLQILDGPRLRIGDDDIEGHRFVRSAGRR